MLKRLIPATALLALTACSDTCANTLVTRVESPDDRHSAVMFQRDCGAATGFSTQISVLSAGDKVAGGGNAFRADDDHGAAVAGAWGGPWAETRWLSKENLLIRYAGRSRVFEQDDQVSGIRISYEPVGR